MPHSSTKISPEITGDTANGATQTFTYYAQIPSDKATTPTLKKSGTYRDSYTLKLYTDNSYTSPVATTGMRTMRMMKFSSSESNLITEKRTIATSMTTIKKLVPQRG